MHLFILIFLLIQLSFAEELLFFQEEASQWKPTGGSVALKDEEFTLKGSASIDIKTPTFFPPSSGTISFFMRHHLHDPNPLAIVQGSTKKCHCALKLRMGQLELEIGEHALKVQTLTNELILDSVIKEKSFELTKCGDEFPVEIKFSETELHIYIEDQKELTLTTLPLNLHDITFSTFMGAFTVTSFSIESDKKLAMQVDAKKRRVSIPVQYKPKQFNNPLHLKNHHLVVWNEGKAANAALFVTPIPDIAIHRALGSIGAKPGNNLTADSWNKRYSKKSKDPDLVAEGSKLQIQIRKGTKVLNVANILHDNHDHAYNFVFSGNLEFIPLWQSGCVICLQSCPGSKVSNATYTMRDLAKGKATFAINNDILRSGETLWIDFTLIQ